MSVTKEKSKAQASDKVIHLIQLKHRNQTCHMVLGLDIWLPLLGVYVLCPGQMGVPGYLHVLVAGFVPQTLAMVCSLSCQSTSFPTHRGTCQGCLLCPKLFILTLEHLLHPIRSSPNIKGVTDGQPSFKVSLFADDLLLTLAQPHNILLVLFSTSTQFSSVSGLSDEEWRQIFCP